jgi:hypothetical protein
LDAFPETEGPTFRSGPRLSATFHSQGEAWVMRRRTQAEMDELIEDAGFANVEKLIDEWAIFTAALARRAGR